MNTRLLSAIAAVFLLLSSSAYAAEPKALHAPDTLPGVEPEMLSADYWIALQDDADEVIMTPAEIEVFNEKVRTKKVEFTDYFGKDDPLKQNFISSSAAGLLMNLIDPLEIPGTMQPAEVRKRLERNRGLLLEPPALYGSTDFHDGRLAPWDLRMKNELIGEMNMNSLPSEITVRFGIVVKHGLVRQYPTEVPGYSDTRSMLDRFQLTDLCVGNPVAVLHESKDGDYLFIACPLAWGWIAAEAIAIGPKETIRGLTEDRNFVMAASHRVPVYGDASFKNFSHYVYFSGTMPFISRDGSGYKVKLPVRKSDGSLAVETGYIKPDADVTIGRLPYTKRNVLNQIFKLLGTPYGWHGQDNKRDCAITMRVLLRCFGIMVGKNPAFILNASDHKFLMNPALSNEEKTAEAKKLEPVITMVGNSGHIALLLGEAANGKVYYIHQAGWGYKDEDGVQRIVGRVVVNWTGHGFYSISSPNVFTTMRN